MRYLLLLSLFAGLSATAKQKKYHPQEPVLEKLKPSGLIYPDQNCYILNIKCWSCGREILFVDQTAKGLENVHYENPVYAFSNTAVFIGQDFRNIPLDRFLQNAPVLRLAGR